MLKYAIVFCVLSFCNAMSRTVFNYEQLVIIQRSPVTAFYSLKKDLINEGKTLEQIDKYLTEHAQPLMAADPKRWIMHTLLSRNASGHSLMECKDSLGNPRLYINPIPSEAFRNNLKLYWPSSLYGFTEEQIWTACYNIYGSCINDTPVEYFQNAIGLLISYNIGVILEKSRILPGKKYPYDRVSKSIIGALEVHPLIKCYSSESLEKNEQYLLEIHLCFSKDYELIDCTTNLDFCDKTGFLIYPKWEED